MIYKSSSGDKVIADMALSHAKNALNKLLRTEPERKAEIDALQAHVDKLSAEATAKALDGDGENPRAVIGGNNPPADEPAVKLEGRTAIEAHVDDLLTEAANWADGFVIENQAQADAVGRIKRKLEEAAALVNNQADTEKRPHNEAVNEIAAWQNGYIAKGLKKTPDGKLTKAILATGNMSTVWLVKLDKERREREAAAAAEAAKAADEALAAREEAKVSTDLAAMDKADDMLADAEALIKQAKGVSREKVVAGGGEGLRAVGLRSYWSAEITNRKDALMHYLAQRPEEFEALIQRLADADARGARPRVPGVTYHEEKRAA